MHDWKTYPSESQHDILTNVRINMVGAVAVCMFPDDLYAQLEWGPGILDRLREADKRVQGNRGNKTCVTFADERLMLANTLRILLEELEKA